MSILNKPHRTFTAEFKLLIINKYLSGECSSIKLSYEYDLDARMIRRWVSKFRISGEESLVDHRGKHGKHAGGRQKTKYDSELEQLRQENLRLKGENFLLKKLKEHREKQKK
jgi:transposase-like protein